MRALAFERFRSPRAQLCEDAQILSFTVQPEMPRAYVRLLGVFVVLSYPETVITTALESRFLARRWNKRRRKRVG